MIADQLPEIEAIRKLKARYFRCMDQKRWDELAEVFAHDAVCQWDPQPDVLHGREAITAYIRAGIEKLVTVHHGHMPEIEITGPRTAHGIWAMSDLVVGEDFHLEGFGHYEEDYVKEGDGWRIRRLRLTRLRVDVRKKSEL
ncbi:MAG: Bile acid 7-alpha dehydratase [Steroidobacteraceae bacterium]|nr:Bile acid 7-alpha dehydratase [Steroidobacteraceae bacterium]